MKTGPVYITGIPENQGISMHFGPIG